MYSQHGAEAELAVGWEPRMNLDALFAVVEEARQRSKRHEVVVVGSLSILCLEWEPRPVTRQKLLPIADVE